MTLAEQLEEAEDALQRLMTGHAVVRFQDQNGESVTYNLATVGRLSGYVEGLRRRVAGKQAVSAVVFKTSKGV